MDDIEKHLYRNLLGAVIFILALGTIFYHFTEKWNWIDAYYFCVVTLATVGYGDLVPKTEAGKLFTTFYIMAGVGIITAFFSVTVRRLGKRAENRRKDKK